MGAKQLTIMTTKIKWRLANRPTPHEVLDLANAGILTKDEAREILFSLETDEDRSKRSLQEEIKFLRSVIQKLSTPTIILQTIKEVQKPYQSQPWYRPYASWSLNAGGGGGSSLTTGTLSATNNAVYLASGTGTTTYSSTNTSGPDFTSIDTF